MWIDSKLWSLLKVGVVVPLCYLSPWDDGSPSMQALAANAELTQSPDSTTLAFLQLLVTVSTSLYHIGHRAAGAQNRLESTWTNNWVYASIISINIINVFLRKLAALSTGLNQSSYSYIIEFLRVCLSFSLLRSAIACLHNSRSSTCHPRGIDPATADQ